MLAALGLSAETSLFVLAACIGFHALGYTLAEAGAAAVMTLFMGVSLVHQIDFLVGSSWPGTILEFVGGGAALGVMLRLRSDLRRLWRAVGYLLRREPLPGTILAAGWTGMLALLVTGGKTGPLPDGLTALMARGGIVATGGHQALQPMNVPALFYHTARFDLGPGACGFGLLAHLAVGLSTYALARRHAFPAMALTVTLVVVSVPRLVFLGLNPTPELIGAASVSVCLLMLYRLLEQAQGRDLSLFLLCTAFSIQDNPLSLALAAVLLLLLMVVMVRRHGWLLFRELMTTGPPMRLLGLPVLLMVAQLPVVILNFLHGRPLLGVPIVFEADGIVGAAANLLRYLFVCIDPTEPLRRAVMWLLGVDLQQLLMGIYSHLVVPLFGQAGAAAPFQTVFSGAGEMGVGPLAPLLMLPAMGVALWRGTRRLKAVTVAWLGYLYMAALILAWQPTSRATLSPLFAANGFVVAFSLPPWRLRRRGMRLLQLACALLLVGSLAYSQGRVP